MQIPIADALDDLLRLGAAMLRVPAPPQKQASEGNKDQVIPGAPIIRSNCKSVIERGCEHPRADRQPRAANIRQDYTENKRWQSRGRAGV